MRASLIWPEHITSIRVLLMKEWHQARIQAPGYIGRTVHGHATAAGLGIPLGEITSHRITGPFGALQTTNFQSFDRSRNISLNTAKSYSQRPLGDAGLVVN